MHFIPNRIREKIQIPVYILCFFTAIVMILQVYPFSWAGQCTEALPLCGKHLCSVSGNWHIAWDVNLNGLEFPVYAPVAFILPFIYGSWKTNIYHILVGPGFAYLLTDNMNEWPAIWCLLSIGILMIVVKTPLRKILYVKNWFLWSLIEMVFSHKGAGNKLKSAPEY